MKPILFLDIDGVLNFIDHPPAYERCCVDQLNRVLTATSCNVVLSSAWRYMILQGDMTIRGFATMLKTHGVRIDSRLIGHTDPDEADPSLDDDGRMSDMVPRGVLIQRWLSANHRPELWAAVDDEPKGMERVAHRLVTTDGRNGLTEANADKLIEMLKTPTEGYPQQRSTP